jgi:hypothetical protein
MTKHAVLFHDVAGYQMNFHFQDVVPVDENLFCALGSITMDHFRGYRLTIGHDGINDGAGNVEFDGAEVIA